MTDLIPAWVEGRLTPVDKLEVHRLGLLHPAVSVFLLDGKRTLIQRRSLAKYHTPGLWANACCTHPHWGEAASACAARRLGEELGLHGLSLQRRETIEYRADVGNGLIEHELVDLFTAETDSSSHMLPNPLEIMDLRWITLEDLRVEIAASPESFTPWLRIYLADHRMQIFGAAA